MGMHVHVGDRTDRLVDGLAALLAEPLPDPFASEVVVVPAKGVERWLTQRLSHRLGVGPRGGDGVCAGVEFRSPRSLVALLTDTERTDPWDPDRLVWPVLAAVDASLGEPWCTALARHLGEEHAGQERELRRGRRWSVARRLAALLAAYAVQRPALLRAWSDGRDEDGTGEPLAGDLVWQAHLWRRVTALVEAATPFERHDRTLTAIGAGRPLALPDRLSLFGHTRLSVTEVELLRAVAQVRDVHLWLPSPSPALWRALEPVVGDGRVPRSADTSALTVTHPLLSSLGRDTRELRRTLTGLGPAHVEVLDPSPGPSTLLGRLQADVRTDSVPDPAGLAARVLDPGDRSVQVHAAHGRARQVEVLREVLVGLLEDDPTLEPRDVLVMCPDIDAYAPLFDASFGLAGVVPAGGGGHPAHRLRLRLADRAAVLTNPFLALAAQVLEIAAGRATVHEVLALIATAPVRHRFGLGDDDLATLASWAEESGVRWGLTAGLRADFGLDGLDQNTWSAGLDRLLVGVAVAEGESLVGQVLPLDDVPSADVDLAGRLAELVDRLQALVEGLRSATALREWLTLLHDGVRGLGSAPPSEAWQVAQLERELSQVGEAGTSTEADAGPQLRLTDLRALLEQRSGGRPTRANFRTGSLTVCTMVPMRSVPHRVVCLVGLDDGVFPRAGSVDGDDVLARRPLTGERDGRSEDRQLLLDAVLAATERLVVTYTGAHEVTGQERPPAVPLGELIDALDATAVTSSGVPVHEHVLVRHPLQAHDPRSVTPGALGVDGPFSFDPAALAGARAAATAADELARGHAPRSRRLLDGPLPPREPVDVSLADLHAFLAHPAKAFLRQRLDVAVEREHDEPDDALPLDLSALDTWAVGDRMLRRLLEGVPGGAVVDAERRRGELPPGDLAEPLLLEVGRRATALVAATQGLRSEPARSVDVVVDLGGGRRLTGVVSAVRGSRVVRVVYSSLAPKHRLAAWVDLLALAASHPEEQWTASTVGWKGGRDRCPQLSTIGPLHDDARALLLELVDLRDRGLREALPMAVRTSHTWAEQALRRRPPDYRATHDWETDRNAPVPGEQDDAAHRLVHGAGLPFAELKNRGTLDERWNDESSALGRYAVRLWAPLLEHERVTLQ